MFSHPESTTLHVYYVDRKCKEIAVMDESKSQIFYSVECHYSRPNLIFHTPKSFEPIARVSYFHSGCEVKADVNGRTFEMKPKSKWTQKEWSYDSPSLINGQGESNRVTWKGSNSMVCTDENGMPIARYKWACWAMKKLGTIEIMSENLSPQAIDEIAVMGLSLMVKFSNQQIANASSASAASAASAAAAAVST